jgi:hypothetical protein
MKMTTLRITAVVMACGSAIECAHAFPLPQTNNQRATTKNTDCDQLYRPTECELPTVQATANVRTTVNETPQ